MTALGRILQVIGWLWIAVGLFGPIVDLPDISVFPGIIVLFISRVIRKQGQQAERRDQPDEPEEERYEPRILNTERQHQTSPEPRPRLGNEPILVAPEERDDLLERVLLTGKAVTTDEMAEDPLEPKYPSIDLDSGTRLTSAEMIARAHRRWDRRS
jgi:hypothetical protein